MQPTIGRIVLYKLLEHEKKQLGYAPKSFDTVAAVVVRVWSPTCVNLKTLSDGPKDIWVTSKCEGIQAGEWHWPQRISGISDTEVKTS